MTKYYFFLLLGLRLKDLLIGFGINPLVLLCLGFLNRMPRNIISEIKIRVSITAGPIVVWKFLANLLPRWSLFSIIWKILGDYLKLKIGKNRRVGFSLKQELKWFFQQGLLGDLTTCKLWLCLIIDTHSTVCNRASCQSSFKSILFFGGGWNCHIETFSTPTKDNSSP